MEVREVQEAAKGTLLTRDRAFVVIVAPHPLTAGNGKKGLI